VQLTRAKLCQPAAPHCPNVRHWLLGSLCAAVDRPSQSAVSSESRYLLPLSHLWRYTEGNSGSWLQNFGLALRLAITLHTIKCMVEDDANRLTISRLLKTSAGKIAVERERERERDLPVSSPVTPRCIPSEPSPSWSVFVRRRPCRFGTEIYTDAAPPKYTPHHEHVKQQFAHTDSSWTLMSSLLPPSKRLCFKRRLFVCSLAGLCKTYSTDFHRIRLERWHTGRGRNR